MGGRLGNCGIVVGERIGRRAAVAAAGQEQERGHRQPSGGRASGTAHQGLAGGAPDRGVVGQGLAAELLDRLRRQVLGQVAAEIELLVREGDLDPGLGEALLDAAVELAADLPLLARAHLDPRLDQHRGIAERVDAGDLERLQDQAPVGPLAAQLRVDVAQHLDDPVDILLVGDVDVEDVEREVLGHVGDDVDRAVGDRARCRCSRAT